MAKGMHAAEKPANRKKKTETRSTAKAVEKKPAAKTTAKKVASKSAAKKAPVKSAAKPASKKVRKTGGKNAITAAVLIIILLAAAAVAMGVFAGRSDTIHPNLSLNGISVGGMTVEEAEAALTEGGWETQDNTRLLVKLPAGYDFTVTAEEAGLTMDCREAAEVAYAYGHSGNIIQDLMAYFKCIIGRAGTRDIIGAVDADGIRAKIDSSVTELNAKLKNGYIADTDKKLLYVVKGAEHVKVDSDVVFDLIINAFDTGDDEVEYSFEAQGDASCDFMAIHDAIYAEALSAKYDPETQKATESRIGIDFDVSKAEKLFAEAKIGDMVEIPLKVTMPDYTTEQLNEMLFRDCLGKQTTIYSTSGAGRCTNVELSASKINGIVLNPGDSFSYNDVVGKRTSAAGFKSAAAYSGGKVVQEIGGGICQTSSTLYCAVLYANLKIDARDCHHFAVSYLPYGMDATVSWGGPEFKFTNNRDLPVKIVTRCENRNLTVEIWGTDIDGSYVEITSGSSTAENGISATTYRCVYDRDGNLISRTQEARSFYYFHTEDEPEASPEPTAEPSAEPTVNPQPTGEPEVTPQPTEVPTPQPTEESGAAAEPVEALDP